MQQHVGECDFPIEMPVVVVQPVRTRSRKKYLFALFLPVLVACGWFYTSSKPVTVLPVKPVIEMSVAPKVTPVIPPVVPVAEPSKIEPKKDIKPVVAETPQPLDDDIFALIGSIEEPVPPIIPDNKPIVSLNPVKIPEKTEVVKTQPESPKQVGDPLGGVMDPNNKWLQADINNILVVAKEQPRLKSADTEMEEVAKFLTTKANPAEAPSLRFFTFYTMPTEPEFTIGVNGQDVPISVRQAGLLTLSFVLNSTANLQRSQGNIVTPTMLPGSDTICYINIDDFGWTPDQWDRISKTDPYMVEPLIQHSAYNLARLAGGNMLFRGDWFISHATDAQRQADAKIPELIYYNLLYDNNVPKNGSEFRKALGVDLDTALKDNLDRRVIMESGKSGVSVETGGNRKIQGIRTPYGYYWETFDTKNADFLNNLELDDKVKDAGELIGSHKNGMQVYLLVNQDDNRVEFADNGLVEDTNPMGKRSAKPTDRRVKTAASCMVCHASGINPVTNSIAESLQEGVQLNVMVHPQYDTYKDYQEFRKAREKFLKLDRKYVNNGINNVIDADNRLFEQAVRQANGLIPSQNAYLLWAVRGWYDKPLDLKQAAVEAGVPPSEYVEKTQGSISARINRIVASDKFSIPRRYWENLSPAGDYAHSILTIKLHTPEAVKIAIGTYPVHATQVVTPIMQPEPAKVMPVEEKKLEPVIQPQTINIIQDCQVLVTVNGQQMSVGNLRKGDTIPYIKFDGTWYQVNQNGQVGFVFKQYCAGTQ